MKYLLTINLLSDICPGSGGTVASVLDTDAALDSYGIPVIHGKRIKGLFREAAMELEEFGMTDAAVIERLFGAAGKDGGIVIFPNLFPENDAAVRALADSARNDALWGKYIHRQSITDYYTVIRSQTALDENGVADTNTLRSVRVIKKETGTFEGMVLTTEPLTAAEEKLLERCAAMVRHIGLNRSRGLGHVRCTLGRLADSENKGAKTDYTRDAEAAKCVMPETAADTGTTLKTAKCDGKSVVLPVRIRLVQPCIIETNYIAGNVVRGIYAAACNRMGAEEETFNRLILSGRVSYGFCWPEMDGKVYYPAPVSLLKDKKSEKKYLYDMAAVRTEEAEDFLSDREGFGECYAAPETADEEIRVSFLMPERLEYMHHRRPEDRSYGHAMDGDAGQSDGQMYFYEALAEGQRFYGELWGNADDLEQLKGFVPDGSICHIGASKSAQYGWAVIEYPAAQEPAEPVYTEDRTVLTLISPMVVTDDFGMETTDVKEIVKQILPDDVKQILSDNAERILTGSRSLPLQIRSFCKTGTLSGFNAKWKMPVPQRHVLLPGSVIVIEGLALDDDVMQKMERKAYGCYQAEGYGRIRVNWHGEADEGYYEAAVPEEQRAQMPESYDVCGAKNYMDACIRHMLADVYREDSGFMAEFDRLLRAVPNSHVLSGLQRICQISASFEDVMQQLGKAADRARESNKRWCDDVLTCLSGGRGAAGYTGTDAERSAETERNAETENAFYRQGVDGLRRYRLPAAWEDHFREVLREKAFELFRSLALQKIYDVHLELSIREQRKEKRA